MLNTASRTWLVGGVWLATLALVIVGSVAMGARVTVTIELDDQPLLADLLCIRGRVELARGDRLAARAALVEAERIAAATNATIR